MIMHLSAEIPEHTWKRNHFGTEGFVKSVVVELLRGDAGRLLRIGMRADELGYDEYQLWTHFT